MEDCVGVSDNDWITVLVVVWVAVLLGVCVGDCDGVTLGVRVADCVVWHSATLATSLSCPSVSARSYNNKLL